jgi:hypothetical protein
LVFVFNLCSPVAIAVVSTLLFLHVEGVVVFIAIIVDRMDMWSLSVIGRRINGLLIVLQRLVILLLEVQLPRRCSCSFIALLPLHRRESLVQ